MELDMEEGKRDAWEMLLDESQTWLPGLPEVGSSPG